MGAYTTGKTTRKRDIVIGKHQSEISKLKTEINVLKDQRSRLIAAIEGLLWEHEPMTVVQHQQRDAVRELLAEVMVDDVKLGDVK